MYPKKINIIEVGPRDGFQNIDKFIDTNDKLDIIRKIGESGFKRIEVTSFVNPKWVPQMKDSSKIVEELKKDNNNYEVIALAPNPRGAEDAILAGVDLVNYVISVSEAHNKANVNRTINESMKELTKVSLGREDKIRVSLATVFGCPFEEIIDYSKVVELIQEIRDLGIKEIVLADTIGTSNPKQIREVLKFIKEELGDTDNITIHIHNTRGMGLANILVAIEEGYTSFETSIGGLGGCPFAPGAAGNVATEDLINMLDSMGIESDINMNTFYEALKLVDKNVSQPISSNMWNVLNSKCNTI